MWVLQTKPRLDTPVIYNTSNTTPAAEDTALAEGAGDLQQSTAIEEALKMSWDSSATFHTRQVLSMPPDTARSARLTSRASTSACRAGA